MHSTTGPGSSAVETIAGLFSQADGKPARARDSDARDFRSIYAAWFGDVLRWIRALGAPPADHDDLAQEVFVVVYRRLADFDGRNVGGWLYRITANQVRDHRRLRWIRSVFRRSVPVSEELEAPGPTPVMAVETLEKRELLQAMLAELSEPLRATFVLFEVDGYTAEEIAAFQRSPINTVRARIHRARKKLLAVVEQRKIQRP
ncbi:MAG TPA: RNA polymerase sigma factor [Polyangia bacterium]|nr:RNA polymerase sigma factor [Polyangia bacterium]